MVQIEDTEFLGAGPDGTKRVRIKISVPPGYDVRQVHGTRAFICSRLAGLLHLHLGVRSCCAAVQLHACRTAQLPLNCNLTAAAAAALLPSSPLHCDRWAVTWRQAKWSFGRGTTSTPLRSASWRPWVPPPCSEWNRTYGAAAVLQLCCQRCSQSAACTPHLPTTQQPCLQGALQAARGSAVAPGICSAFSSTLLCNAK